MRIEAHQVEALRAVLEERRASRIAWHLRDHRGHLVKDFSAEELLVHVRDGVRRATAQGITWDSSLAQFIVMKLRERGDRDAG
jgi:hypothetical protein